MSSDQLSTIAGVILSLLFSYVPGVSTWYSMQSPDTKRVVMLVAIVLVAGSAFALSCWGLGGQLGLLITCDQASAWGLIRAIVACAVGNQVAYKLSPASGSRLG